jgi:ribonuclease HII
MPDFILERSLIGTYPRIAGIDEAGRGALAGPVVASAVVIHDESLIPDGLNDSKRLSPQKREELYNIIIANFDYGIGVIGVRIIDQTDILSATMLAMETAIRRLKHPCDYLLIDGSYKINFGIPASTVVKGDGKSFSIAAASIIAKVTRDNIMTTELCELYPEYQFDSHKGYGTELHYELIRKHGISDSHRKSFLKKILSEQTKLF